MAGLQSLENSIVCGLWIQLFLNHSPKFF